MYTVRARADVQLSFARAIGHGCGHPVPAKTPSACDSAYDGRLGGCRLRLCFITCVACIGTTFAIVYPLVFHRFSVPVTRGEFLVAGVTALSVTLLGVSIGVYFDEHWIGKRSYALLGVIFVTVLSLIAQPLTSDLPHYLRWLIWILPPASRELYAVAEWTSIDHTRQILILAWALVYPLILMMVYVKWIGKKLHD